MRPDLPKLRRFPSAAGRAVFSFRPRWREPSRRGDVSSTTPRVQTIDALVTSACKLQPPLPSHCAFPQYQLAFGHNDVNAQRQPQFPLLHRMAAQISGRLGLTEVPAIYVLQEVGALNAVATRFVSRNFVVVYSDIVELAYEQGEAELAFVLAHELAHVELGHLAKKFWLYPATFVPFLSQAYSRACESSCDAIGAALEPAAAVKGILVLASGKRLYREMDLASFVEQARQESDIWMWLAEHLAGHPNLPKRVDTIGRALPSAPTVISAGATVAV
jgi:Zn-dependent protease with chaperone function